MQDREELLFEVFEALLRQKNECASTILSDCGIEDMTVRQIAYLKTIDAEGSITFTRLAGITRTSKPTITEMINRCARLDCVERERSTDDARVRFIRLTEKGRLVAHAEENALRQVVDRITESLDDNELDLLIGLLLKIR